MRASLRIFDLCYSEKQASIRSSYLQNDLLDARPGNSAVPGGRENDTGLAAMWLPAASKVIFGLAAVWLWWL